MCGIAGYLNLKTTDQAISSSLLESMQKALAHRGPDGYRIWIYPSLNFGIIHRRLSILDLSQAGFQPLFDDEQSIAVCCNGEIYNYPTLKKELEGYGYRFKSNSDTEAIVYAYKQWGIACLNKLEGMFAIVIADLKTNQLYFVRDRIGIKPLYFSTHDNKFSFASEIKALWQLPWITKEINVQAMYHYLTYMVTPAPLTLYNGVYKLPAGHYIKIDAQKNISFTRWYNPLIPIDPIDPSSYASESTTIATIRTLLRNSVQKKLLSDVPVGAFLSGGIDSSLLVAFMAECSDNVKTFNVSFADGQEYSEIAWARKVARRFNTDHHEVIISEKEAFEFFQDMVYYQDEPLADCVCIPLYYVSKLLKDAGVTVVLVGEGSDELFCGYSTYARYIDIYNRYWRYAEKYIPAFATKSLHSIIATLHPSWQHLEKLKNLSEHRSLFWGGATVFGEQKKQHLLKNIPCCSSDPIVSALYPDLHQTRDSYNFVRYHLQQYQKCSTTNDFLNSMIYLELQQRLPELLLMRVDKMTMATSVEARVPFLDHLFVEYALQVPSALKYKDGITKYILKKAAEGILPHEVIYRPKIGFAAPTTRWFKSGNYFKPYFKSLLNQKNTFWAEHLDMQYIKQLFEKNEHNRYEYSLELWTLQNLMANTVNY